VLHKTLHANAHKYLTGPTELLSCYDKVINMAKIVVVVVVLVVVVVVAAKQQQ